MTEATLILVRHGQSQWNLENRFTGWWDVDLTEKGEAEAVAAGAVPRIVLQPDGGQPSAVLAYDG